MNSNAQGVSEDKEYFYILEDFPSGFPIISEYGMKIKNVVQGFIKKKELEYRCLEVSSPLLVPSEVYKISGHIEHYSENMFPSIKLDKTEVQLRPMNCPSHCLIFSKRMRSYKDFPFWFVEHSILHRLESSGSIKGTERTRWMEISDNHIFVEEEKIHHSFIKCFQFIVDILDKFEIKISNYVCSLRDVKNISKYHNDEEMWKNSERILLECLEKINKKFIVKYDEAAFYGPKLDFEVENSNGKFITLSTIQLDPYLPRKFGLEYIGRNGENSIPFLIHFSSIGTYQRLLSVLLEQHNGKLPFFISPIQIVLIPLNNQSPTFIFVNDLCDKMLSNLIRVEIWSEKTLAYRKKKVYGWNIPYYLIIGKEEITNRTFNLQSSRGEESSFFKEDELVNFLKIKNL